MSVPFKLQVGHTIILTDDYGRDEKFYVREVQTDGWMFEPYNRTGDHKGVTGERKYYSGEKVKRHYLLGRMTYEPWDDDVLPAARQRRLELEFAAQPEAARLKAIRRKEFVLACEKVMQQGFTQHVAYVEAPAAVIANKSEAWLAEDTATAFAKYKKREEDGCLRPGEYFRPPAAFRKPCERTVWSWTKRFVESGRVINSLLDDHKGKNAGRSYLTPEQDNELALFFSNHVKSVGGFVPTAAFRELDRILKRKKIPLIERRTFLRRLNKHFDQLQLKRARFGAKATRRAGRISDPGPIPSWPLQQTEADHVLLKVNCIDDETGTNYGLSWLAAVKDRSTGMPTGLHMSCLAPSWATTSRAIAHSIWPKDLSSLPYLKNHWPAEGRFDELYTDRGMDFISNAGRFAAAENKFEILNLPGYQPWLKGSLERWNRTVKAEILSYGDGIRAFNDPELRGKRYPSMTKSELRASLLEWLVDEYNVNGSDGLTDRSSPMECWLSGLEQHGPPRPVEDMSRFRRMTMVPDRRSIQDGKGVEVDGFFFKDLNGRLAQAKRQHPSPDFLILIDPWDMGYIELLAGNEWLLLLNTDPSLSGITRYRSESYWDEARLRVGPNKRLGIDDFLRAREFLDDDAGRVRALGKRINRHGSSQNALGKFLELGEFITPVPLRDLRFKPMPVEIEGWRESGGILRPEDAVHPRTGRAMPAGSKGSCWEGHDASPEAMEGQAGASGTAQDLFERLSAAGRARARQMNA